VPQTSTDALPVRLAVTNLRISAGITWLVCRSKLSPGPYRFTGKRKMPFSPYCCRYAWSMTSRAFLATPYGALVSSGYPFQSSASLNGTGVNFGYAQIVPTCTNFLSPTRRACSIRCSPMAIFA